MIKVSEFITTMTKPANVDYYTIIDHGQPDIRTDQLTVLNMWGSRGVKSWFQSGKKLFIELREEIKK